MDGQPPFSGAAAAAAASDMDAGAGWDHLTTLLAEGAGARPAAALTHSLSLRVPLHMRRTQASAQIGA